MIKCLFLNICWLISIMLLMGICWEYNLLVLVVCLFTLCLFWVVTGFDADEICLFVFSVLFFQIGEIVMVHTGVWVYSNPTYLGIPIWLPVAWGFTNILMKRIYFNIANIRKYLLERRSE